MQPHVLILYNVFFHTATTAGTTTAISTTAVIKFKEDKVGERGKDTDVKPKSLHIAILYVLQRWLKHYIQNKHEAW